MSSWRVKLKPRDLMSGRSLTNNFGMERETAGRIQETADIGARTALSARIGTDARKTRGQGCPRSVLESALTRSSIKVKALAWPAETLPTRLKELPLIDTIVCIRRTIRFEA